MMRRNPRSRNEKKNGSGGHSPKLTGAISREGTKPAKIFDRMGVKVS